MSWAQSRKASITWSCSLLRHSIIRKRESKRGERCGVPLLSRQTKNRYKKKMATIHQYHAALFVLLTSTDGAGRSSKNNKKNTSGKRFTWKIVSCTRSCRQCVAHFSRRFQETTKQRPPRQTLIAQFSFENSWRAQLSAYYYYYDYF